MGSPPTLGPTPARPPNTGPEQHRHALERRDELLEHLRTPTVLGGHEFQDWPADQIANGFAGDLAARHRHDHTRLPDQFGHSHTAIRRADPQRDAEEAFDQLNPGYGVPADQRNHYGKRAVQDREAALALGLRVAVHDSRQNDPNPVIWQAGQDYRAADAIQAARHQPVRRELVQTRHGPERVGPER